MSHLSHLAISLDHIFVFFLNYYEFLLVYEYGYFACMYVHVPRVCLVLTEAKRKYQTPGAGCELPVVLEIKPRSSGRAASDFNCWAISLAPYLFLKVVTFLAYLMLIISVHAA